MLNDASVDKLNECHPDLQLIAYKLSDIYNFVVYEGYRDKERQDSLRKKGLSKVQYPNSKHNTTRAGRPHSLAFDCAPIDTDGGISWDDREQFLLFAGHMLGIAHALDIPLRWGGDWDSDKTMKDQTFNDLVHFELK